jgi:hypothetical protein
MEMDANSIAVRVVALLAVVVMTGCASGVRRADDTPRQAPYFAGSGKVARDVTIALDKNAQAQLSDNLKFSSDRLLSTVKSALGAKNLLAKTPDAALPAIEILVTDIRVRSNFSAIMFGFMAGSDQVAGDVVVRDAAGKELQRFSVSASYALGGIAGGQDEARMGWLYETFAKEMINELTGNPEKAASN